MKGHGLNIHGRENGFSTNTTHKLSNILLLAKEVANKTCNQWAVPKTLFITSSFFLDSETILVYECPEAQVTLE